MKSYIPFFILLWSAVGISKAAKIVIVPPILFESHLYIFKTLASALYEHGHQTVFLLSEGREIPPSSHYRLQRYPGLFNTTTSDEFLQSKMKSIFSGSQTAFELFDILDHYSKNCDMVVGNKKLLHALKKGNFDLLLVDPNEMCGFVIAHLLGIKYAVFSTGLWYPAEVGAPAPLAYVPEFNSLLTDHMNFLERFKNTIVYLVSRFGVSFLILPKYERIMQKYSVQPARSMYELVHESSLWMLCTDVALEFPRPTLPNVVYVGGILTKPASPLPEELQTWVNGATENGFVLVSFGAGVKYLPEDIANKLAHALARLPQRVIWRFSGKNPRNLGNNTKLLEWLPQNDLLGHSNIKAFLSHGGLNSIFETMYHGVPVVGIPLFGDHYDTMTRVQAKGMGILLSWKTLTEDELYNALVKVINDPSYKQQARKLSEIHRDQPAHPVNRTVYWINYILRHNGAQHLQSAVYTVSLYQYFLLDIAFVALLCTTLLYYILARIAKFICNQSKHFWSTNEHITVNGHYQNGIPNGKYRRNGHIKHEKKVK